MNNDEYYKAYEKRYKQVYSMDMLWSSKLPTTDVVSFIENYNVSFKDKILDLGCGEGRDAIYLLEKGYNVLAIDYSDTVIGMCNKLTEEKFVNNFRQFDIFEDELRDKFDYIYSVAVLHMFLLDKHRNRFLKFIRNHLSENGHCLLCVFGDGEREYISDIRSAFNNTKRIALNYNKEVEIVETSCRIVNWRKLEDEILENDLIIEKKWISKSVPDFSECMCVIVKVNNFC